MALQQNNYRHRRLIDDCYDDNPISRPPSRHEAIYQLSAKNHRNLFERYIIRSQDSTESSIHSSIASAETPLHKNRAAKNIGMVSTLSTASAETTQRNNRSSSDRISKICSLFGKNADSKDKDMNQWLYKNDDREPQFEANNGSTLIERNMLNFPSTFTMPTYRKSQLSSNYRSLYSRSISEKSMQDLIPLPSNLRIDSTTSTVMSQASSFSEALEPPPSQKSRNFHHPGAVWVNFNSTLGSDISMSDDNYSETSYSITSRTLEETYSISSRAFHSCRPIPSPGPRDDRPDNYPVKAILVKDEDSIRSFQFTDGPEMCEKTANIVETQPLKKRRVFCCFLFIILSFSAFLIGGKAGINYNTLALDLLNKVKMKINIPPSIPTSQLPQNVSSKLRSSTPHFTLPPESRMPSTMVTTTIASNAPPELQMHPTIESNKIAPTIFEFLHSFPEIVSQAVNDPESPQSLAYTWLQNDQEFKMYSSMRKMQRFVLVVFYYATNGDNWTESTRWISHNDNECNWYTDEMTGIICDSDDYETLHLHSVNITGTIPLELFLLASLERIDFSKNALEGTIPIQISSLSNLRQLDLYDNNLSGFIPSELTKMKKLTYLDLGGNMLNGSVPKEFSSFKSLKFASFFDNDLTGSLSMMEIFTTWKRIDYLNFGRNGFSGVLPPEIGLLSSITMLDVSNNDFVGTIPTELGLLTDAKHMYLNQNSFLQGPIPSELGQLSKLEVLWLHGTNIYGAVPDEVCALFTSGKLQDLSINCLYTYCFCGCTCRIQNA